VVGEHVRDTPVFHRQPGELSAENKGVVEVDHIEIAQQQQPGQRGVAGRPPADAGH
jgi:hypothetical protein